VLHPLHTYREVPGGALAGHLDRTLVELGIHAEPSVLVRGPQGSTLIRSAAKQPIERLAARVTPTLLGSAESSLEASPQ
jgi:hypothetical protein